ncbi:natural killer cell receptor 2B4 [Ornithorhynchus anatinus]|uniref:CD244 molecule n=1 Tax=Ornithorhynchus anatinus TaxID=9258 RepID=A0A6I8NB68_ORNAN|nr:natural killer cell receptor 2B4 [Ornithorhynchus anatinus]
MTRTTFLLLLLWARHSQGSASTVSVNGVLGGSLWLHPPTPLRAALKVEWSRLSPDRPIFRIVSWENSTAGPDEVRVSAGGYRFSPKNFSLQILQVEKDSGGLYEVDITDGSGQKTKTQFHLSVFDAVRTPSLRVRYGSGKADRCLANLSCSTEGRGPVAFSWYARAKPKRLAGNSTLLELALDVAGPPKSFACNVSNPVAWAQAEIAVQCPRQAWWFIPALVLAASTVAALFCLLGCLLVRKRRRRRRRRRRKMEEIAPATLERTLTDSLTVYEEVGDDGLRTNKRKSGHRGGQDDVTVYSTVHRQTQDAPLPTPNADYTVYSSIQNPKHAPRSKQRTPIRPPSTTVYQEVGWARSANPGASRLSRKELEAFHVYS